MKRINAILLSVAHSSVGLFKSVLHVGKSLLLTAVGRAFGELQWTHLGASRFDFYRRLWAENARAGGGGMVEYRDGAFGPRKYLVTAPRLARRACQRLLDRPANGYAERDRFTHSLFNLNAAKWERKRKLLCRTAFSPASVASAYPAMYDCARTALQATRGGETDAVRLSRAYVTSLFFRCVFGRPGDPSTVRATERLRHADTRRFGRSVFGVGGGDGADDRYAEASRRFKRFVRESRRSPTGTAGATFLDRFDGLRGTSAAPDEWDDDDTDAHCAMFFTGGYAATVSAVSFAAYEIARDVRVQERLRDEIARELEEDRVTFRECRYLDCAVKEVLRKYPPFAAITRACSDDDVQLFAEPDDAAALVRRGATVVVPVSGLHYDPAVFPEPDAFDPTRWCTGDDRRAWSSSYMPFGSGPRRCLGETFATLAVKAFVVALLESHRLTLPETCGPPKFLPGKFTTNVDSMTIIFTAIEQNESARE